MHGQCLVAVYPSRNEADQAFRAAVGSGIPSDNIRVSGADMGPESAGEAQRPGMWDWLFGSHIPETDRTRYRTHLAEGRTALSVLLDGDASPARIDAVEQILERYHPVDVRVEEEEEGTAAAGIASEGEEEIIPLAREEMRVGTRVADRVRHIRTYVVEEPVEKEVSLRDERVVIEKRPATMTAAGEPSERDYEFHERHEEPVVEKTTRADEELVVRKEPRRRTERVRDTVRRTKADVQEE